MKTKYLLIITFIFAFINCSDSVESKSESVLAVKDIMTSKDAKKPHDFSWNSNDKDVYFTEKYKGKVVFLNIWGTWCPPCRKEIPDIIKLQKDFKDQGLVVVGISTERGSDIDQNIKKVSNFASTAGINYTNFVMSREQMGKTYAPRFVPTSYIIDRNGDIVDKVTGGMDYNAFKELVSKYL